MIYTITFNPAIDYIAQVNNIKMNEVNRVTSEKILAGGKGINVSVVLKNLGIESIALGFIAGFTGKEIQSRVEQFGIKTDFVYIPDKFSRINVKLQLNIDGIVSEETEYSFSSSFKMAFAIIAGVYSPRSVNISLPITGMPITRQCSSIKGSVSSTT